MSFQVCNGSIANMAVILLHKRCGGPGLHAWAVRPHRFLDAHLAQDADGRTRTVVAATLDISYILEMLRMAEN